VGELPGGTLHGAKRAVDADQSRASGVPSAGSHLVAALRTDLRPEPLLARCHESEFSESLAGARIGGGISGRRDENPGLVGHGNVLTCGFVGAPPGTRTLNPRIKSSVPTVFRVRSSALTCGSVGARVHRVHAVRPSAPEISGRISGWNDPDASLIGPQSVVAAQAVGRPGS